MRITVAVWERNFTMEVEGLDTVENLLTKNPGATTLRHATQGVRVRTSVGMLGGLFWSASACWLAGATVLQRAALHAADWHTCISQLRLGAGMLWPHAGRLQSRGGDKLTVLWGQRAGPQWGLLAGSSRPLEVRRLPP